MTAGYAHTERELETGVLPEIAGNLAPPDSEVPSVLQKLQKWGDYEAVGDVVKPTNFIPMKTPLSTEVLRNWSLPDGPKHSLTVSSLLSAEQRRGRRVGLIIDLSNHETLYAEDLPGHVLQYEHVQLMAKVFPSHKAVVEVIRLASEFWSKCPEDYVAIHCAYGFNRTGFVVCCYLVQMCGLSVDEALASFAAARPPGVRHENFVEELHRRYDAYRCAAEPQPIPSTLPRSSSSPRPLHSRSQASFGSMFSDRDAAVLARGGPCMPVGAHAYGGASPPGGLPRHQPGSFLRHVAPVSLSNGAIGCTTEERGAGQLPDSEAEEASDASAASEGRRSVALAGANGGVALGVPCDEATPSSPDQTGSDHEFSQVACHLEECYPSLRLARISSGQASASSMEAPLTSSAARHHRRRRPAHPRSMVHNDSLGSSIDEKTIFASFAVERRRREDDSHGHAASLPGTEAPSSHGPEDCPDERVGAHPPQACIGVHITSEVMPSPFATSFKRAGPL